MPKPAFILLSTPAEKIGANKATLPGEKIEKDI
jgi:hypothetical protein